MSALDRILTDLRYYRIPHACKWINYQPHREREPQVEAIINDTKWAMFFTRGKRGWLLKSVVAGRNHVTTLGKTLDAIAAEGARLDTNETQAQAELTALEPGTAAEDAHS